MSLTTFMLCSLALSCLFLPRRAEAGAENNPATPPLRTLTTALETHSLPASEAIRRYPVHLTGVVTYFDPYLDPRQVAVFVHDASGSMFAGVPVGSVGSLLPGALVDVQGVSGMGDFAPVISHAHITVIGRSHLPATALPVSVTRLSSGDEDGQWVEVEGVIHSVLESKNEVVLKVVLRDGQIAATIPRRADQDYKFLVDAKVRIDANAAPLFDDSRQVFGAQLLAPDLSAVHIVEPGPGDAFKLPLHSISALSRFRPPTLFPHRVQVHGRVTLAWPGSLLCIRDDTHGLCAQTKQSTPVGIGEMADIVGFAEGSGSALSLTDAVYQSATSIIAMPELMRAMPVTAEQAQRGRYDSDLVQLDGQLIGRDLTASDTTLMLASEGVVYTVLLPATLSNADSGGWKNGSRLRVTGICSVQLDEQRTQREGGEAKRNSFRVLLRSSNDVVVLQNASWWTPAHAVMILAVLLTITLLVLGLSVVLSRRLRQQTRLIRKSEEEFRHLAQHDALTGLPTRLLLRDRLDNALEKARRSGTGLALLMLDLDNFKQINDSLGHHAGDQALKISAVRLAEAVRRGDTVARISGDEFIVLIDDLNEVHEAELVAAKIVASLSAPFRFGDRDVPLSASVGVCTAYGSGLDADALLKSADAAMYHAKARGRNCFELYTADMGRHAEQNLRLRAGLRQALPANELEVHYQPMVSFKTGELIGFEALLRWRSKEMGLITPGDFIPVAEQTGLIVSIGEWVLRQACSEIGELEQQLGQNFMLSVNLSPRQIQNQPNLSEEMDRVLSEFGRSPHRVEFEITESMLMSDSVILQQSLTRLREMGVRLAIDDFGMGLSSLSYINRFSIDRIKIDRSFIRKCTREGGDLAVVRAMVAMAHGLSMEVVAEGIETAAEFSFLRQEGCDVAQGFYLSRPMPAHELLALVPMVNELVELQSEEAEVRL